MSAGIYGIRNKVNGKIYVGSSKNIKSRWATHKHKLKKNIHHSIKLQNAWNKYGAESFEFFVIQEVVDESKLFDIEQEFMDLYQCWKSECGYNINPVAWSGGGRVRGESVYWEGMKKPRTISLTDLTWEVLKVKGEEMGGISRSEVIEHVMRDVFSGNYPQTLDTTDEITDSSANKL